MLPLIPQLHTEPRNRENQRSQYIASGVVLRQFRLKGLMWARQELNISNVVSVIVGLPRSRNGNEGFALRTAFAVKELIRFRKGVINLCI